MEFKLYYEKVKELLILSTFSFLFKLFFFFCLFIIFLNTLSLETDVV